MASPESRGVAAGRFAPFHRGHQHLIERARGLVDSLDVVVVHEPDDVLAPELRTGWIRDAFAEHPQVQVHAVPAGDDPAEAVRGRLASDPDLCFTGKGHDGWSAALAQRHVEIEWLPGIESDVVRADALAALDQLPGGTGIRRAARVRARRREHGQDDARARPRRRAGDGLGARVRARLHRDAARPAALRLDDARLRDHLEAPELERGSRARYANRIVIVDTDAFATSLFHELYVGYRAPELDAYLRRYDLYLLTSIDTPFQMDVTGLRYDGDTSAFMDATYRRHAEESGAPWAALRPATGATAHGRRGGRGDARALRGPAALTDLRAPAPVRVAAR